MTSDPTQLAPARFYGFARTRTAAENFSALTPPSSDATSIAVLSEPEASRRADSITIDVRSERLPILTADATDAPNGAVLIEPEPITVVTPPDPQPAQKAKSRSRKKPRPNRKASRSPRTTAKPAREPEKRLSRLELHQARCSICGSELQEEIDGRFVNWDCVSQIVGDYTIDRSSLYRHAHATGLMAKRDRNIRRALCHIIQYSGQVNVTADSVVRAVKTFAHINARGEWVNPPTHVVFTSATPRPAKPPRIGAETSGTPSHLISSPKP